MDIIPIILWIAVVLLALFIYKKKQIENRD